MMAESDSCTYMPETSSFVKLIAQTIVQNSLFAHDRASGKKAVHSALSEFNEIVEGRAPFHVAMQIRSRVLQLILRIMKAKANSEKFGSDKMRTSEAEIMEVWFMCDW